MCPPGGVWGGTPRDMASATGGTPAEDGGSPAGHGIISADALPGGTDGPKMVHEMVHEGLELPKDRPKTLKMASRRPREPLRRPERPLRAFPGESETSKTISFPYVFESF